MRDIIIILFLLFNSVLSARAQHPVGLLKTHFSDSGYVKTRKWSKSFAKDTTELLLRTLNNKATVYYDDAIGYRLNIDMLSDKSQWSEQQVSLKQHKDKLTYALSLSRSRRFGLVGHQLNTDLYWVFNKQGYINVDLAIGEKTLYPMYRGALKFYYTGIKKIELGGGYGYIQFDNNPVHMLRASLGAYLSNFYLYVEYLNIITQTNNSHAIIATLRNYISNGKGYFMLNASAGMQANKFNLSGGFVNSSRVAGGLNFRILPRMSFEVVLATEKQQIREGFSRDFLSINTGVFYHFQANRGK